jgi:hypothetical protein
MAQARAVAQEYRAAMARGDVVVAGECRRTLDDLHIGSYVDGRWTLSPEILALMGERE